MNQEKVFANGFSFKKNAAAPEFVVGKLSIKTDEAVEFIQSHVKKGWINIDIKQAKNGNYYCELDTYEPVAKEEY
jgi:hypothetical protein